MYIKYRAFIFFFFIFGHMCIFKMHKYYDQKVFGMSHHSEFLGNTRKVIIYIDIYNNTKCSCLA